MGAVRYSGRTNEADSSIKLSFNVKDVKGTNAKVSFALSRQMAEMVGKELLSFILMF